MAQDTLTLVSANGAIAVAAGVSKITKATEGEYTLANPVASATSIQLEILSGSDANQEVTGSFFGGGGSVYTKLQFTKYGAVRLRSDADGWYICGANRGVTMR
jgi:hypothetical protein